MLWKKTIIMLCAFAFFAILAVVVNVMPTSTQSAQTLDLPKVAAEDVTKIQTLNTDNPVTLEKKGSEWVLMPGEFKADEKAVAGAIESLVDIKTGHMVSKNPRTHKQYKVSDDDFTVVVSTAAGEAYKLIIGQKDDEKQDPRSPQKPGGDYVRLAGEKRVFTTAGRLKSKLDREARQWRDRQVVSFDKEKASRLTLNSDDEKLVFTKGEDGKWNFETRPAAVTDDYKLDSEKVQQVINALANLNASEFVDENVNLTEEGIQPPLNSATVEIKDGAPITIFLGKENDKKYYAKKSDGDQVYLVSSFHADKIRRNISGLRDMRLADFDPTQAVKIDIRDGDRKLGFTFDKKWNIAQSTEAVPEDFLLDDTKVKNIVRSAARFQGSDYIGKSAPGSAGLSNPAGLVSVTLSDGSTHQIKIGNQAEEKKVYTAGDDGYVFLANDGAAKRLLKNLSELKVAKAKQQPTLSPDALKNLPPEVAQQLLQQQRQKIMQNQVLKQMMKKNEGAQ